MRQLTLKQEMDKEHILDPYDRIGRSILLSSLGAMKSSMINRTDCILMPTQSGWILHLPLTKKAKGVIP